MDVEVAVVGAGVVGSAVALDLARRGASVALLEAEAAPGLAASGTNSGILHTGFDSTPGELETRLILRSAEIRDSVTDDLAIPVMRCGAMLRPRDAEGRATVVRLAENARSNGVYARVDGVDGSLHGARRVGDRPRGPHPGAGLGRGAARVPVWTRWRGRGHQRTGGTRAPRARGRAAARAAWR